MELKTPFAIAPNLEAGLCVDGAWLTLGTTATTNIPSPKMRMTAMSSELSAVRVYRDWSIASQVYPLAGPLARKRLATILRRCRRVCGRRVADSVRKAVLYGRNYPHKPRTEMVTV